MKITAVILAAGTSSRMAAGNKLLLDYSERTVIEQVLLNTADSNVDDVLVITGYESNLLQKKLRNHLTERIRLVHNADYQRGRAASVKCALSAIDAKVDAALFMVGDKPDVRTALMNRILERFRREHPSILHVRTPSGRGHPIIFDRAVFHEFMPLEGDFCANEILVRYGDRLIVLDDHRNQIDIDSEADYRTALARLAESRVERIGHQ